MAAKAARSTHLVPATAEEIRQVLEENGVRTIDDEPAGVTVLHGYAELIRELDAPSSSDVSINGHL